MQPRDLVFISYHHNDRPWLELLETHLQPLLRRSTLSSWSDTQVPAGSDIPAEVERALERACVVVLLVSADYLASTEIEYMIKKARTQHVTLLWLPVRPSAYKETELATISPLQDPTHTLALLPRPVAEEKLVQVCERIVNAIHNAKFTNANMAPAEPLFFEADSTKESGKPKKKSVLLPSKSTAEIIKKSGRLTVVGCLLVLSIIGWKTIVKFMPSNSSKNVPSANKVDKTESDAGGHTASIEIQINTQPEGAKVFLANLEEEILLGYTPIHTKIEKSNKKFTLIIRLLNYKDEYFEPLVEKNTSMINHFFTLQPQRGPRTQKLYK